ncbi:MAG: sugar nucleotide-binding protein, partial [Smithella sp.]
MTKNTGSTNLKGAIDTKFSLIMKVLIIGAKGMLGQELVREFGGSGYEIISWDKEEIDITKKDLVLEKIKSAGPEIIINAAAYNAVDKI